MHLGINCSEKTNTSAELGYFVQAKGERGCRMRMSEAMNKALLAKLAWMVLTQGNED